MLKARAARSAVLVILHGWLHVSKVHGKCNASVKGR